jgi:hypothetical protein
VAVSKYSELRERKLALREEIREYKSAIQEQYDRKRETPRADKEWHAHLDSVIDGFKYHVSQCYDKLTEIDEEFERLNIGAAEGRARKARRRE